MLSGLTKEESYPVPTTERDFLFICVRDYLWSVRTMASGERKSWHEEIAPQARNDRLQGKPDARRNDEATRPQK